MTGVIMRTMTVKTTSINDTGSLQSIHKPDHIADRH